MNVYYIYPDVFASRNGSTSHSHSSQDAYKAASIVRLGGSLSYRNIGPTIEFCHSTRRKANTSTRHLARSDNTYRRKEAQRAPAWLFRVSFFVSSPILGIRKIHIFHEKPAALLLPPFQLAAWASVPHPSKAHRCHQHPTSSSLYQILAERSTRRNSFHHLIDSFLHTPSLDWHRPKQSKKGELSCIHNSIYPTIL